MGVIAANVLNTVDLTNSLLLSSPREDGGPREAVWATLRIVVPCDVGGTLRVGMTLDSPDPERMFGVRTPQGDFVRPKREGDDIEIDITPGELGDGNFDLCVYSPGGEFTPHASFVEHGYAREGPSASAPPLYPWNFWFFPYQRDSEDDRSVFNVARWEPLTKYEAAFGVDRVRLWEEMHHSDAKGPCEPWEGHCDIMATASVLFDEPPERSAPVEGIEFTREELKFLAGEVLGRYPDLEQVWTLPDRFERGGESHAVKPSEAPAAFATEPDSALRELHRVLRQYVRDRGEPLVMDLRDEYGEDPEAVWNHAVYRYYTYYTQNDPDDVRLVTGTTVLIANEDTYKPDGSSTGTGRDSHTQRLIRFTMRFGRTGIVDIDSEDHRWYGMEYKGRQLHAPRLAVRVKGLAPMQNPSGKGNPLITREHVLSLVTLRKRYRTGTEGIA